MIARFGMLVALAVFTAGDALAGDQLLIDQGRRIRGLWLFPVVGREHEYRYLPNTARLASDEDGNPEFSFIRYVSNELREDSDKSITQASGGAVLHFLVLYETDAEQVRVARRILKKEAEKSGGPEAAKQVKLSAIAFDSGRYSLVSSILSEETAEESAVEQGETKSTAKRQLLETGRAPVLEGQRIALSFELAPEQSMLLMQSFRMATPDVSLVFDLVFNGLEDAYDAELIVDWDQFHTTGAFAAGGSAFFVSADIEMGFDELRRDNAIQLVSRGGSETMESLVDRIYGKLLDFLFRPVVPEQVPEEDRGDMWDALGAMVEPGGSLSARNLLGFGANAAFELRHYKTSGRSVLNFNQQDVVDRHSYITFNIGDFYAKYGDDKDYFRTVNLDDAAFQQREVHLAVDGQLVNELGKAINSVTVTLRKQHEDGSETVRELVVDRQKIEDQAGDLRMVYGWQGDDDRVAWLGYDYRTEWRFEGGNGFTTDWVRSESAMIDLLAPYERQKIELMGSAEDLSEQGVRAVVLRVEYPFFGETKKQQVVVRPSRGEGEAEIEITLPREAEAYEYTMTWMLAGGGRRVAKGRDENFFLLLDEIPEPEKAKSPSEESAPENPAEDSTGGTTDASAAAAAL